MDPSIDAVRQLLVEAGFEIAGEDGNAIRIKDLESGIPISCVLEDSILFNTVSCLTIDTNRISPEQMSKMLDSQNGISTSGFQLYNNRNGQTAITLNNFAKLQQMGEDDRDDILSCICFLIQDVIEAKELLRDLVDRPLAEDFDTDDTDDDPCEDEDECDGGEGVEAVTEAVTAAVETAIESGGFDSDNSSSDF